MINLDDTVAFD